MEWQLRNWLYFTWLSGDHIVEQHVHNLDVVNWAMQGHPVRAVGMGGRQVRTGPEFGHIFDHFAIDYEYAQRRAPDEHVPPDRRVRGQRVRSAAGHEGHVPRSTTTRSKDLERGSSVRPDSKPYEQEHTDLIASIRAGKPYNELKNVAESTLTAIMGRMSAYTGKAVTWEQALESKETWAPKQMTFGTVPVPPVPMPGVSPLT